MRENTLYSERNSLLAPITGWFDPTSNGGAVRRAANSYLPAKGDPGVRLPGLRRGDLVTLDNGRVLSVNGGPPAGLSERPDFANLGAVHHRAPCASRRHRRRARVRRRSSAS